MQTFTKLYSVGSVVDTNLTFYPMGTDDKPDLTNPTIFSELNQEIFLSMSKDDSATVLKLIAKASL